MADVNTYKTNWNIADALKKYRYYYLAVFVVSLVLSFLVISTMQKTYSAQIKIVDERKYVDLLIGLNKTEAFIKNNLPRNTGMENPNIYSKMIYDPSFIRDISKLYVKSIHQTYYDHIKNSGVPSFADRLFKGAQIIEDSASVYDYIKEHLQYQLESRYYTVTIQVTDRDPVVAAEMVNSICSLLQKRLTEHRYKENHRLLEASLAQQKLKSDEYHKAVKRFADFCDTHNDNVLPSDSVKMSQLQKDRDNSFDEYRDATIKYQRSKAVQDRLVPDFTEITKAEVPLKANSATQTGIVWAFAIIPLVLLTWIICIIETVRHKKK